MSLSEQIAALEEELEHYKSGDKIRDLELEVSQLKDDLEEAKQDYEDLEKAIQQIQKITFEFS